MSYIDVKEPGLLALFGLFFILFGLWQIRKNLVDIKRNNYNLFWSIFINAIPIGGIILGVIFVLAAIFG